MQVVYSKRINKKRLASRWREFAIKTMSKATIAANKCYQIPQIHQQIHKTTQSLAHALTKLLMHSLTHGFVLATTTMCGGKY